MKITRHAEARRQQRGNISRIEIEMIMENATHFSAPGGATRCLAKKKDCDNMIEHLNKKLKRTLGNIQATKHLQSEKKLWLAMKNKVVVVAEDYNTIITVYYPNKRIKH